MVTHRVADAPWTTTGPAGQSTLLEVRHVTRSFGRRQVLRGVSFAARPGEMIGVVGENGAGKSTLLKIVAGLLPAASGSVSVRGRLGYCPQEPQVHPGLTVLQNLEWFRAAYRLSDPHAGDALVEHLGFAADRHALVETLSGGTRQKLNLTIALMHNPDVILLDEPYQGFDWETYLRFWEIAERVRGNGCAVVVISHLFFERGRFDRVLSLRNGALLGGAGS